MKLRYLVKGFPGLPVCPPPTGATIGISTFAAVVGVLGGARLAEADAAWAPSRQVER